MKKQMPLLYRNKYYKNINSVLRGLRASHVENAEIVENISKALNK